VLDIFFSHAWVSGCYQFEYARRLGFKKEKIIFDLLSSDLKHFNMGFSQLDQKIKVKRNFVFIGRVEEVKGVKLLLEAWSSICHEIDWGLIIIGSGSNEYIFNGVHGVKLMGFLQPSDLSEILKQCHCLILPSLHEPWALVVQEAAASGLSLILSDTVGARSTFLIDNYNGFVVASGCLNSLKKAILQMALLSDNELIDFSLRSAYLSTRISPTTSAFNLLSLISRN